MKVGFRNLRHAECIASFSDKHKSFPCEATYFVTSNIFEGQCIDVAVILPFEHLAQKRLWKMFLLTLFVALCSFKV